MNACKNLAAERKRVGLTQSDAAEKLKVSTKTLAKYENDPFAMPGDFIVRAADLYGCTASYLLDMADERCSVA